MFLLLIFFGTLIEISYSQNQISTIFLNLNIPYQQYYDKQYTYNQVYNYHNLSFISTAIQRETFDCLNICGINSTCNLVTIAPLNNLKLCSFFRFYFPNLNLAISPGTLVYYKKCIYCKLIANLFLIFFF